MTAVLFVVTAAAGTFVRWQLWENSRLRFVATFVVNVVGAFLLGLMADASADSQLIGGVAGLGAMTTFSTLVAELADLAVTNRRLAVAYGVATFVAGVGAAWLGLELA